MSEKKSASVPKVEVIKDDRASVDKDGNPSPEIKKLMDASRQLDVTDPAQLAKLLELHKKLFTVEVPPIETDPSKRN